MPLVGKQDMKNDSVEQVLNLVKSFRWNSLLIHYFKKTLVFVIPNFLIVAILLFGFVARSNTQKQDMLYKESFQKTSFAVNDVINSVNQQYYILSSNPYVAAYYINEAPFDSTIGSSNDFSRIQELLKNIKLSSNYICDIYLHSFRNSYVMGISGGSYVESFQSSQWYAFYQKNPEKHFVIPKQADIKSGQMIDIGYEYYVDGICCGIVVFEIDLNAIREMETYDDSQVAYYFVNGDGALLYASAQEESATDTAADGLLHSFYQSGSDFEKKHGKVLLKKSMDLFSLTLMASISLPADKIGFMSIFFISICILLILLIAVMLSLYFSYQMYNSIVKIIRTVESLSFDDAYVPYADNEVAYIQRSFYKLSNKQQEIEQELSERLLQLKKAQNIALQTQFNPHFLFNTLNLTIFKIASITKSDNEATQILHLLSELLCTSLDTSNSIVSVQEEIRYAKSYAQILLLRYNNNFDIAWEIAEETLDLKTIKLILQPIIENAFEHGIQNLDDTIRGKITISSVLRGDRYSLIVHNNGAPIAPEQLQMLQEQLDNETMPEGRHIGILNVNIRIKLLFGAQYGCRIISDETGTEFIMDMPADFQ